MAFFKFKICLILTVAYIKNINSEYNESVSEEYELEDNNSSLNSESLEVFNVSSKENRIDSEDISEMENETLHMNKANPTVKPAEYSDKEDSHLEENGIGNDVNQTSTKKFQMNYPFSVSIQRKSSHYSSGALVDKQWVLTAAGEFYNVRESIKLFKARLGSVNCKKGGVLLPIKWVEIHPSYVYRKPAYDVALLKLATPVEFNEFIAPIAISQTKGRVVSAKFLTTYWPRLIIKGEALPSEAKERFKQNYMRVSTQKMIPKDKCDIILQQNNITLDRSTLCLEPIVSHHSPCMPDPGAPLVAKGGLWGITSGWRMKKCTVNSTTLSTRLTSPRVHSWLQLLLVDI